MIGLAHSYLCVRDLDRETGAPVVGDGWEIEPNDGGWYVLRRERVTLAAYRANAAGTRALWALFGPKAVLDAIAAVEPACMPMREAWAKRGDAGVRSWLRRWRTWRIDGFERDAEGNVVPLTGQVRTLVPEGAAIPDPTTQALPWNLGADGALTTAAGAVIRVTAIVRPALGATLAGLGLDAVAEDEPERR